ADLHLELPTTLGDISYSYRNRKPLPEVISRTAPDGYEWKMELVGRSAYAFLLRRIMHLEADPDAIVSKALDQTPGALLDLVPTQSGKADLVLRSGDLLAQFLSLDLEHVHSQLRTTLGGNGQIEISALFAECGKDEITTVVPVHIQTEKGSLQANKILRNLSYASIQFPNTPCRAVVVQVLDHNVLALFEIEKEFDELRIVQEHHVRLIR
ncbi:MAG: hypothetical protein ABJZ79_00570, partial [Parasphingorhabdus sp.]|uniref:hypothetical protein n=1 Tax=Parasphingorhabdus sp. TaxID=2709688 RepID=UPI003296D177